MPQAVVKDEFDCRVAAMAGEEVGDVPVQGRPVELGGRLAGRSLSGQVWVLAFWPFLQQLLTWLVGAVDTAVAGRLSVAAASALGAGAYFGWFLTLMTSALGTGGAALVARAVGSRKRALANAALGQAFVLAVAWGVVVGAVVYALAPAIAGWAGLEGQAASYATIYIRVLAIVSPLTAIVLVGGSCLTAAGDTRTPFFIMLLFNVTNVVATVLLAIEPTPLWGPLEGYTLPGAGWGVSGIAWGTAIATAVGACFMVWALVRQGGAPVRLRARRLPPHPSTMRRIVRVGLPSLGEGFGHWLGNFLVLLIVGRVALWTNDASLLGAHIVAIRVEAIAFLPAMAVAAAAGTLSGQYLGAGSVTLADRAVRRCWLFAAAVSTTLGLTFVVFPHWWVSLMTDQPELLATSPTLLRIAGAVQLFFSSALVLQGAMRGAGATRIPMVTTLLLTWGLRLPLVWVLAVELGYGLVGAWVALSFELAVRGVVFAVLWLRKGWAVGTV